MARFIQDSKSGPWKIFNDIQSVAISNHRPNKNRPTDLILPSQQEQSGFFKGIFWNINVKRVLEAFHYLILMIRIF